MTLKDENKIVMNGTGRRVFAFSFGGPVDGKTYVGIRLSYSDVQGFGWLTNGGGKNLIREVPECPEIFRSFILGKMKNTFKVKLPKGRYRVALCCGDAKGVVRVSHVRLRFDRKEIDLGPIETRNKYLNLTQCDVDLVEDGGLHFELSSDENDWALCYLTIYERLGGPRETRSRVILPELSTWAVEVELKSTVHTLLDSWQKGLPTFGEITEKDAHADYLDAIEGVVDFFSAYQNEDGAIIDAYRQDECENATTCYAYAATLIALENDRGDLLESAVQAYGFAARALGQGTAVDGHEDYSSSPLAHTYRLLKNRIDPARLAQLSSPLSSCEPHHTYRKPPGGHSHKRSGSNWNCKSLAGQYLLFKLGLQGTADFTSDSLLRQSKFFNNEFGLYAEGPMTYDAFPRAWLADMLDWGYDGAAADELKRALISAAFTSLFMQSPTGELPTGGRTSQHIWSDAVQCVTFEWAAKQLAKDAPDLTGVFKRAARRALDAVTRWRRDSGEFCVVKNCFNPALGHGFDSYTSHSQFNLLCVTALGFAHEIAESFGPIEEQWTPSENGSSGFVVRSGIEKAFATANGMQVEVAIEPTKFQTPRGIVQVKFADFPGQIPLGDGLPDSAQFNLPNQEGLRGVAFGLAWLDASGSLDDPAARESVANLPSIRTNVKKSAATASGWFTQIRYVVPPELGPNEILESIEVARDHIAITWNWSKWTTPVLLQLPVFAGDGRTASVIQYKGGNLTVEFEDQKASYTIDGSEGNWTVRNAQYGFRLGLFRLADVVTQNNRITVRIHAEDSK